VKGQNAVGGPHRVPVYQVDAFTDVTFGGNPAGVVPDASGLTVAEMQLIAREMALSETAFVLPPGRSGPGAPDLRVRFFTPKAEVALCGHATIGTFFLLAERGIVQARGWGREVPAPGAGCREIEVVQETGAGDLAVTIRLAADGQGIDRVMMAQAWPVLVGEHDGLGPELAATLRAPDGSLGAAEGRPAPLQVWSTGLPDVIVPVRDLAALRALAPDLARLAGLSERLGVISVHAFTTETVDPSATAHARDFSPAVGVPEEAATGTASGAMGAYLVANGLAGPSQAGAPFRMTFEQGHILGRPSTIYVEVGDDAGKPGAVRVGGRAVTVLEGLLSF